MPTLPLPSPDTANASLAAARDTAAICDLTPLHVLEITGPDAATFLQGQLSIDVVGLRDGACRYSSFNSPKGRMLANFLLWKDAAPDTFLALVPGELAQPLAKRLSMYVLRSKVRLTDVSANTVRFGVGGPSAPAVVREMLGAAPAPFATLMVNGATALGLPGSRIAILAPADGAALPASVTMSVSPTAPFSVWQWLTIRAGVPVVSAATQDMFVAQTANMDLLGGIDFQKGCYTGQEIIARMQYLGRLKERAFLLHADTTGVIPGARLFSGAFGDQPCGTVVNAAEAPGGGSDLLAVLQLAAAERGDARLGAPDGPELVALPLPYEIPAPVEPRGRIA